MSVGDVELSAGMPVLPDGAQPVEGVSGYHSLIKGSTVTVFGPDGSEIASATRRGYNDALVGKVGDTRLVSDGLGDRRLTSFAELAARHHLAALNPGLRDRVWVRWEEDGVAAVYGTDKYDDADRRAVKAGNLYWSGQRQGWATGRKWNPGTRDRNLAEVLLAFARQDRNVLVLRPGQEPEDLEIPLAVAPASSSQAVPVAAVPIAEPEPEPEPEPEDFTGLTYEDLVAAEDAADMERSRRYTSAGEIRYQALRQERGRRLLDRVATSPAVTELSSEDLAAESEWWQKTIYQTPFHSSDEEYRTLERRRKAVTSEQYARTAQTILAGPAPAELDDAALESAYEQIGSVWTRLPRDHELHDQVAEHRKALQEERIARRARSYGERPAVADMTLEELTAENADLESALGASNEQSAYSYSDAIKEARAERLRAVGVEWDRRGLEQFPEAARASLGSNVGSRRSVLVDGSERAYGYLERRGRKHRALSGWDERSSLGDFDSRPAAMAALVRRYDQDPETLPRRTWGHERTVMLPVSAFDPLVSWLRRRPGEVSREVARTLEILTPYTPTQTKVMNPLNGQVMRAYPFSFEEGLLGELARIAERTTEDLREQSLNENVPKREREAAKRRIPAMGAALIGINAVIEQVRAAGGDVERRGVDQARLAAQMAALAGTVNEEGNEADDDDNEPVRDAAAAALGGVSAAGAGRDGGPGSVLPDAGDADGRGDRRGGGGPGGDTGAGDGLPGPGRADPADRGDRAGAGTARDAAAAGDRGEHGGAGEPGGPGAGGDPQGAGEPVGRFRPDPADLPRGPLARAEANLEAVKVLRQLESAHRGATTEEKRVLARWSGWGSVPTIFLDEPDPENPVYQLGGEREGKFEAEFARWETYSRIRGELRELLDPFEWRAASRATLSAHYTPQRVAEAMWQGLAAFGFDGGEVLEAGCGSGAFFGVAPPTARLTGVELDTTTAAIAARIYPQANVLPESFTDTDAPTGTFDAVIGNVPFAQSPFGERRYGATGHSLHNGFIIKQLALLRPGAYMAVITSRWTLDGEDTAARRAMARWGDLAGAYRLPAGTFGETADTDVVADVLIFRGRAEGEEPADQRWIEAPERELGGNALRVNAYFTEHPENVLGHLTSETGPYGPRVTVQGDPSAAGRLLRERIETTAAAAVAAGRGYIPHEDGPDREALILQTARDRHATDFTGRLYTDDQGRIWQHVNGEDPIRVVTADGITGTEQLRMLLSLRNVAGELQGLDRTGSEPDRSAEVRGQLSRMHAAYTAAYGPLSRPRQTRMALPTDEAKSAARDAGVVLDDTDRLPTGWGWFRQDPHAAVVLGLEHWDRENDRPVPSEVLSRRPGARRGDLEPTNDPKTALAAVMGATGRVDLPLIASLLGTTPEQARQQLGTQVFDNPVTKTLEHAGAYLSGPVRQKLDTAREAAATDPTYAVNVAALEAVQPPPKRLGQFTAQLGAHWVPPVLVQGFLREYLGDPTLQISHNERYGWSLAAGKVPDAINALKGTERRSAVHIAKALLGRGSMVVGTLDGSGVDEDATRAMRYKADAMRSAFEEYCTASTGRVTILTDAYNRQMNGHVVRSYDGLAPTLAGFTTERTPHPWQLSGAARMQFERGVVLAHEVGLGKTTTMVMGSQALKASGQIGKPYAVVQPHLARQWLDEATMLYPTADIHLITSDDLAGDNRRRVLEWLRSNTPDLVIFTEGAFGSIRMSPEQQELYLFREIEALKEQLERERGVPHNAFALMKLEQRLATVEARIRRNDAPMRTPGEVYWDDLGFDYACIDEAHRFTAVGFRSKEAGGETASVRAVDLHQKLTWHHRMAEYDGGRPTVTLGTGTPMENTIFEQYAVLDLAAPWLLDQFGVHGPDLWSETFGQKVQRIEMAPDGSGLAVVERFSRFVSKATMKTMWGLAADTKTGEEVGIERPRLAGGAPKLVLVEPTADQRARLQSLVARGQAIHAGDVTREEDNMLAVSGEGRAVALDPRLVDAKAPAANKLVEAADIIAAGYHAHKDHTYAVSKRDDTPHPTPGGLFFVFCNSGTPGGNNKGNFDLYAELRDLLAARGVPRDLVQFAQDNATPEKKATMSQAANHGGIAVLMGSTEVLSTGFNGQNRAYALMHLDQDWTPASMIQRNGRIVRPGNQHEEVNVYFLATKGSMDAWQVGLLTSKAEGLRDIQRPPGVGDDDNDSVEEIGATDWDYATMAAEIGGNPYMRQFMEAKLHLQGLESDRRNHAADRVRQAELLLAKETELSSTNRALASREAALPRITETTRGDAFRIRIGDRDFDQRGKAGPALRQAVTQALRSHSTLGLGAWTKVGTFGGLDFAVRPEILDGGSEVRAHVGFPDLRHSESVCSIGDLANPRFGGIIIGRLATALEKAEDHQLMDRERVPVLEAEITLLNAQQAAVDYGTAIEHARRRVELLDAIVGAVTERDKLPELTESMLDPEKHRTPESRQKAVRERTEQRAPHQAKVDQAAVALAAYDQANPAPELPTALVPAVAEQSAAEPEPVAVEPPAAEVPAAEVPAAEPPAVEVPAAEPPAVEVPAAEPPAVEVPAVEVPAVEVPAAEVPAVAEQSAAEPEPVAVEPPAAELPAAEVPAAELPAAEPEPVAVELPAAELPAVEVPAAEPPAVELPAAELPAVEPPAVEVPAVELPAVEVPAAEVPAVAEQSAAEPEPVAVEPPAAEPEPVPAEPTAAETEETPMAEPSQEDRSPTPLVLGPLGTLPLFSDGVPVEESVAAAEPTAVEMLTATDSVGITGAEQDTLFGDPEPVVVSPADVGLSAVEPEPAEVPAAEVPAAVEPPAVELEQAGDSVGIAEPQQDSLFGDLDQPQRAVPSVDPRNAHYREPYTQTALEASEERRQLVDRWNGSALAARLDAQSDDSDGHRLAAAVRDAAAHRSTGDQMYQIQQRAWNEVITAVDALLFYLRTHPDVVQDADADRAVLESLRDRASVHVARMRTTSAMGDTIDLLDRIRAAAAAEAPAAEVPAAEVLAAEPEPVPAEPTAAEVPAAEPEPVPAEPTAAEAPAAEPPAAELPAVELPAAELPAAELPAAEPTAAELPAAELPAAELPAAEAPAAELPAAEAPAVEPEPVAEHQPEPYESRDSVGIASPPSTLPTSSEEAPVAEEPQQLALLIPVTPVFPQVDEPSFEAATARTAAVVDALRTLWRVGPAALGFPADVHDAIRTEWERAGREAAARDDDQRGQYAAAFASAQAEEENLNAPDALALALAEEELPAAEPTAAEPEDEAARSDSLLETTEEREPVAETELAERGPATIDQAVEAIRQLRADLEQALPGDPPADDEPNDPLARFAAALEQLRPQVEQSAAEQPAPELGIEGLPELEEAFAAASRHEREYNGAPEWRQLNAVWQSTQRVWENARSVLTRYGADLATDVRWQGMLRTVGIRAAGAVARLSDRLADRLSKAGRHDSPGHRALMGLSRVAQNFASRLRGQDPAERFAAIDAVTQSIRDLRADLVRGPGTAETSTAPPTPVRAEPPREVDAFRLVNDAFGATTRHTREYNGAPEWRRLNVVWPAATRLLGEQRAGAIARYGADLATDIRWQGAERTIAIRTLDTVAQLSNRLAERLASAGRIDSPGYRAMQGLNHTAQRAASALRGEDPVERAERTAAFDRLTDSFRDLRASLAAVSLDDDGPEHGDGGPGGGGIPFGEPTHPVIQAPDQTQQSEAGPGAHAPGAHPALSGSRSPGAGLGE